MLTEDAGSHISWLVSARPLTNRQELSAKNEILTDKLPFGRFADPRRVSPLDESQWVDELNQTPHSDFVFYIHGFNNPPYKKVLQRVENISHQLHLSGLNNFKIIPFFWPTQKDVMPVNNYFQDQRWADLAAELVKTCLLPVTRLLTNCRVHIVAHSMGARLLLHSLKNTDYPHLSQLFLIAPDIENEALEKGNEGEIFSTTFDQVTVFYARDDLALRTSVVANMVNRIVSRRLGQSGSENPHRLPDNVQAIDCDKINFSLDSD